MDTEVSNGASDSNSSGTAVLSRKGLFGKSGVVNESFDANVAIEQDPLLIGNDATNRGHEKADMSTPSCNVSEDPTVNLDSSVVVEQSKDTAEEQSEDAVEKQSEEAIAKQSEDAVAKQSEDAVAKQSGDAVEEQSEDAVEEQSEDAVEEQSEDTVEKQSEDVIEGRSEQITDKTAADDERESNDPGYKELDESTPGASVPFAETSGDLDCKEHDESSLGPNTQDQHLDNQVQEEETVKNPRGTLDHDHEDTGNDGDVDTNLPINNADNDGDVDRNSPSDIPPPRPEGEVPGVAEEICVKKIISMDTIDVEENQGAASISSDIEMKEKFVDDVEDEIRVPEKSAGEERTEDSLPDEELCDEEGGPAKDELQESCSNPEEKHVIVEETEGSGSNKFAEESLAQTETSDEASEQNVVEPKTNVPKRRSSTRHAMTAVPAEVKTSTRDAAIEGRTKSLTSSKLRNRKKESAVEEVKNTDDGDNINLSSTMNEEESLSEQKSLRSRSRRLNVKEPIKTASSTPSQKKARRSVKLDFGTESEKNDSAQEVHTGEPKKKGERSNGDCSRSTIQRRSAKLIVKSEDTPKSGARLRPTSKEKSSINTEKESAGSRGTETPRRGKKDVIKKPDKSPRTVSKKAREEKQESHDPYDIETEMEKHPEPLKNIQMEVQSFGEVKYAKVGSGKYERTEKTAELRVSNLAGMTPRTKQRKSLADLTPARMKAAPTSSGSNTEPQTRRSRKLKRDDDEEPMEVDISTSQDSGTKKKAATTTPKSGSRSSGKRRASPPTSAPSSKRPHIVLPELSAEDLLSVDHPHDEHAPYEPGARVYAMFDGLFYPAIVVSRDGLGRFKVNFVEDNVIKDVPPAGVIPLRAVDRDKDCYFSDADQKDRLAARVLNGPDAKSALAWLNAEFELEQLNDEGEPTGKKFRALWTNLALSKDDWRDYINKKSREATDVITDNIENSEDRQLRRSRTAPREKVSTPVTSKPPTKVQKSGVKSSSKSKSSSKGGARKNEVSESSSSKSKEADEGRNTIASGTGDEQIFAGKLFILTSANRPNTDTGFKKKFMTDFISTHGGLVVDDMKEVDEHPNMERFLISDTHYRTHKYLAALVRAMPCVSHEWIYKCLNEKKLVDYKPFLLPSGVSILDEKEYPLPTERGVLLRNKRVMVHSNVIPPSKKSMSFEQIWVPMVPQLGGEIVSDIPDEEGKLDILLTDHSATASMVEKARKIGCAVVSSEWLIQGIIMDRLPDVNAHHKFLHNGGVCT